ncbi:maleylpyruvate isomerase N-terminal domain-containing protein [Streptomyces sp. NPDC001552]|uniref:maleylpyruvate isomerase N-terminal domain-containing protein n=1 Tax=Streptomyces sp. NPDC001552 TaxID=3364587 RepID=UPI00369C96B1
MTSPNPVITALRVEHDRLAELASSFTDADLAQPSGATRWDVSEVLSHLGSGANLTHSALHAALDNRPRPDSDWQHAVWGEWNAMTRRQRAEAFLKANHALTELLESLDTDTRVDLRVDTGFLPRPVDVTTFARLRLSEMALHSWDVRVAFDDHASLTPEATRQLLHGQPDLLGWISRPEQLDGTYAVIHVTTSAPQSHFTLRMEDRISVDLRSPREADGTLTLPAEAWLRLIAGRLRPHHTPEALTTAGVTDIRLLRRLFPGY